MASAAFASRMSMYQRSPSLLRSTGGNRCLLPASVMLSLNGFSISKQQMSREAPYVCRNTKVYVEGDVHPGGIKAPNGSDDIGLISIHHVGILCENLERSLDFYQNLLGLKINEARPDDKLPYRGAWLWVGSEMIHLMELPNPDPLTGRPEHGGRDRHTCLSIRDVSKLQEVFDKAGISYTLSRSGQPAIFARDPDGNALEFAQFD